MRTFVASPESECDERPDANPTVRFLRRWAAATGCRLEIAFRRS